MRGNIYELMMEKVNGTTFVGIDTEVKVKVRKTHPDDRKMANPHYERVAKVSKNSRVMVFQNKHVSGYGAMVQRRLEAEGKDPASFELGPRAWGTRIPNTPFVEHKGKYYLEVIFLGANEPEYYYNGRQITKGEIIGLQGDSYSEGNQGGLENKVIIRTYAVENITRLTISKETYNDLYFKVV